MKKLLIFSIAILLLTTSCFFDYTKGSGNVISEQRDLPPFNEISLRGTGNLILTQGDNQFVEIITDDNIMPLITTEVKRRKLVINTKGNIVRSTELTFDITIPKINGIYVSGSGSIEGNEIIRCEDIDIKVSGSGKVNLLLNAEDIDSRISGSGKIKLEGNAEELKIKISGSGNLDAKNLSCEDVSVKISGSGDCSVNAALNLDVSVSGSGNIYYSGNPDISTSISGSGSVVKRN